MKPLLRVCLLLSLLCCAPFALAQRHAEPPELIAQGIRTYSQNGLETALRVWLQNSLLDRSVLLRSELAALKYADNNYGKFESAEVLQEVRITSRVSRVYLVFYYERAPLWAWFDVYRTRNGTEVISDVFFNPKAEIILPSELTARTR